MGGKLLLPFCVVFRKMADFVVHLPRLVASMQPSVDRRIVDNGNGKAFLSVSLSLSAAAAFFEPCTAASMQRHKIYGIPQAGSGFRARFSQLSLV